MSFHKHNRSSLAENYKGAPTSLPAEKASDPGGGTRQPAYQQRRRRIPAAERANQLTSGEGVGSRRRNAPTSLPAAEASDPGGGTRKHGDSDRRALNGAKHQRDLNID
ncbi:hypothetical protein FQA47_016630 [Oryzias melastigma]|uniref:Uncharacterized protein n=1 Tax=Oryzias melastigma TaxID=30732 RepID=A0A834BWV8_ORYME|nr:hypothetical protein FQA47_016630 [Oryzias melastigma]